MGAPVIFSAIDWHRAALPADLAHQFGEPAEVAASAKEAISRARERAGANGLVLICGSLYLVGEAITVSRSRPAARVGGRR